MVITTKKLETIIKETCKSKGFGSSRGMFSHIDDANYGRLFEEFTGNIIYKCPEFYHIGQLILEPLDITINGNYFGTIFYKENNGIIKDSDNIYLLTSSEKEAAALSLSESLETATNLQVHLKLK